MNWYVTKYLEYQRALNLDMIQMIERTIEHELVIVYSKKNESFVTFKDEEVMNKEYDRLMYFLANGQYPEDNESLEDND